MQHIIRAYYILNQISHFIFTGIFYVIIFSISTRLPWFHCYIFTITRHHSIRQSSQLGVVTRYVYPVHCFCCFIMLKHMLTLLSNLNYCHLNNTNVSSWELTTACLAALSIYVFIFIICFIVHACKNDYSILPVLQYCLHTGKIINIPIYYISSITGNV